MHSPHISLRRRRLTSSPASRSLSSCGTTRISAVCSPAPRAGSPSRKADASRRTLARELDPQERLDWLRLARTETVGPVTFYALLRRFGSARAALDALPRLSRPVAAMSRRDAEAELAGLNRLGACPVGWGA